MAKPSDIFDTWEQSITVQRAVQELKTLPDLDETSIAPTVGINISELTHTVALLWNFVKEQRDALVCMEKERSRRRREMEVDAKNAQDRLNEQLRQEGIIRRNELDQLRAEMAAIPKLHEKVANDLREEMEALRSQITAANDKFTSTYSVSLEQLQAKQAQLELGHSTLSNNVEKIEESQKALDKKMSTFQSDVNTRIDNLHKCVGVTPVECARAATEGKDVGKNYMLGTPALVHLTKLINGNEEKSDKGDAELEKKIKQMRIELLTQGKNKNKDDITPEELKTIKENIQELQEKVKDVQQTQIPGTLESAKIFAESEDNKILEKLNEHRKHAGDKWQEFESSINLLQQSMIDNNKGDDISDESIDNMKKRMEKLEEEIANRPEPAPFVPVPSMSVSVTNEKPGGDGGDLVNVVHVDQYNSDMSNLNNVVVGQQHQVKDAQKEIQEIKNILSALQGTVEGLMKVKKEEAKAEDPNQNKGQQVIVGLSAESESKLLALESDMQAIKRRVGGHDTDVEEIRAILSTLQTEMASKISRDDLTVAVQEVLKMVEKALNHVVKGFKKQLGQISTTTVSGDGGLDATAGRFRCLSCNRAAGPLTVEGRSASSCSIHGHQGNHNSHVPHVVLPQQGSNNSPLRGSIRTARAPLKASVKGYTIAAYTCGTTGSSSGDASSSSSSQTADHASVSVSAAAETTHSSSTMSARSRGGGAVSPRAVTWEQSANSASLPRQRQCGDHGSSHPEGIGQDGKFYRHVFSNRVGGVPTSTAPVGFSSGHRVARPQSAPLRRKYAGH